jgi:hypothetical protein
VNSIALHLILSRDFVEFGGYSLALTAAPNVGLRDDLKLIRMFIDGSLELVVMLEALLAGQRVVEDQILDVFRQEFEDLLVGGKVW